LMLRATMDTLLRDYVGAPLLPADPADMGAFARRAPARDLGITAPTAGAAAYPAAALAAHEGGPLALECALAHLERMANAAGDR
jgi:hypothetical protein